MQEIDLSKFLSTKKKECASCRRGEINSMESETTVYRVAVRDPDNGRIELVGYVCEGHIEMYATDGYSINQSSLYGIALCSAVLGGN